MSTSVTLPVKKPKAPASNPKVINMITAAILAIKGCKCISLATIKKYITVKYKFDVGKKQAAYIRHAIVHDVENSACIRVGNKRKSESGNFKIAGKKRLNKRYLFKSS